VADYRYIAAHATTGDILHWNIPLTDVEFGPERSGPGSLNATLSPTFARRMDGLLDPGNTVLYVERDSHLTWGGILWRTEPQGSKVPIEAAGFTSYLHRRYDLHGNLGGRSPYIDADPCQVIRDVWAYAQQQPDGDLGVTVDDTHSTARTGTANNPYTTNRWDAVALSDVIDDMAGTDQGLEWTEQVAWQAGRPQRRIVLGAPRLGRRREDLLFATGVNIPSEPQVVQDADDYAQWVVALGSGDGPKRGVAVDGVRNGRLRLEARLETSEKDPNKLKQRAHQEHTARQILTDLTELEVIDHPAVPLSALRVGDIVPIRLHTPHHDYDGWNRITGWTVRPGQDDTPERITLNLERPHQPADGTTDSTET
jgi:hypothetical protein